jgi:N4-gp56 family major capsid protein
MPVNVNYGGTVFSDVPIPGPGQTFPAGTVPSPNLSAAILKVYSKQILFAFQPFCYFDQFAEKRTELGLIQGNTINFLKYNNLQEGGPLQENVQMDVQGLQASLVPLTVREWGNAVSVSELLLHSSFDDTMSRAAQLLGMDYAKVIDKALREQIEGDVTNTVWGGDATSSANLDAADIFSTVEIKDGVETLKTANVPGLPNAGGSYICILHPHQARTLRDDDAWVNAANYAGASQVFNGEIGKFEDTRFVETTQAKTIVGDGATAGRSGTITNGVTEYHAYMIGYNLLAHGMALPVEMRDGGVIDFNRQHNLAYYSIEGFKCIQPESGVVIVSS